MKTYSLQITSDSYERVVDHILLCLKEDKVERLNNPVADSRIGIYYVVSFCKLSSRLTVLTRHDSPYDKKIANRLLKFTAAFFRLPLIEEP